MAHRESHCRVPLANHVLAAIDIRIRARRYSANLGLSRTRAVHFRAVSRSAIEAPELKNERWRIALQNNNNARVYMCVEETVRVAAIIANI